MKTSNIRDVLGLGFLNRRETLIIFGCIHSDMNVLARALGMKAERAGTSVMTINAGMLYEDSAAGENEGLSVVQLVGVAKPELLIIEDFGMKKFVASQAKVLARLVIERINKASTIITSQHLLEKWGLVVGASPEAKSLIRSLSVHARQVVIGNAEITPKRKRPSAVKTMQIHA